VLTIQGREKKEKIDPRTLADNARAGNLRIFLQGVHNRKWVKKDWEKTTNREKETKEEKNTATTSVTT